MNEHQKQYLKLKPKTVLIWFLYSLKIETATYEHNPRLDAHYQFKPRILTCAIFYVLAFLPIMIIGGLKDCKEAFKELFNDHRQGDTWFHPTPQTKVTRVFAYNRF